MMSDPKTAGLIFCCNGPILDPKRPRETMQCCGNYVKELSGPPRHPAWERYHSADREWRRLNDEAAKAHRRMEDAADELERAGEMHRGSY